MVKSTYFLFNNQISSTIYSKLILLSLLSTYDIIKSPHTN